MGVLLSFKKWWGKKRRIPVEDAKVQDILDWSLREPDIECFRVVKDYLDFKAYEDTDLWGGFAQWFGFARLENEDTVVYMIAKSLLKALNENNSNNKNHKRLKNTRRCFILPQRTTKTTSTSKKFLNV